MEQRRKFEAALSLQSNLDLPPPGLLLHLKAMLDCTDLIVRNEVELQEYLTWKSFIKLCGLFASAGKVFQLRRTMNEFRNILSDINRISWWYQYFFLFLISFDCLEHSYFLARIRELLINKSGSVRAHALRLLSRFCHLRHVAELVRATGAGPSSCEATHIPSPLFMSPQVRTDPSQTTSSPALLRSPPSNAMSGLKVSAVSASSLSMPMSFLPLSSRPSGLFPSKRMTPWESSPWKVSAWSHSETPSSLVSHRH